ncbi:MAG: hypothetical protein AAFZ18_05685 [Myxococcota bacterium]
MARGSDRRTRRLERLDAIARKTRTDSFLLGFLVVLACVGLGVTRTLGVGSWEYWLVVLGVYSGAGVFRVAVRGWSEETPLLPRMIRALAHWTAPLLLLVGLYFLEQRGQVRADAAVASTLFLITASCFTAGLHLDPLFLPLSAVLLVMASTEMVAGESGLAVWATSLTASALAVGLFALVTGLRARAREDLD